MVVFEDITSKGVKVNIKIADNDLEKKELARLALLTRLFVSGWSLSSELKGLKMLGESYCISGKSYEIALAYIEETSCPVAVLTSQEIRDYHAMQIFVKKRYRRKGIGTVLANAVINNFNYKDISYNLGIHGSTDFWRKIES